MNCICFIVIYPFSPYLDYIYSCFDILSFLLRLTTVILIEVSAIQANLCPLCYYGNPSGLFIMSAPPMRDVLNIIMKQSLCYSKANGRIQFYRSRTLGVKHVGENSCPYESDFCIIEVKLLIVFDKH